MRLFLGIELPDEQKSEIASMLSPLKKAEEGWEDPHDYHLTLLFIGETPSHTLPDISARMLEITCRPFSLTPASFQFFDHRILYLGFEHSPEILRLRKDILRIYPEFQRREEKEFIPHLTVKRCRRHEHSGLVKGLGRIEVKPSLIDISGFSLFKSEKDSANRKYHVIQRASF